MASAEQLKALVDSHVERDDERFFATLMQLAAQAARQGRGRLAQELRARIDAARAQQRTDAEITAVAQPRGELGALLSASYPKAKLSEMILDGPTRARLDRLLEEQAQQEKLRNFGLRPRSRLLLLGPPGSGKTMTAAALAGELQLPLFTIQLDGVITKFMGESAAKLRLVFDQIGRARGIYLFDEFDAIGGRRQASNDVGEIRRVLNSFLQFLEQDNARSVLVAATNHPELLDPALYRRFDDVIEYRFLEAQQVPILLKYKLAAFDVASIDWEAVTQSAKGLSQAELTAAAIDAAKVAVLGDYSNISTETLIHAISEKRRKVP
jgi:SpoVK/Ycf46/Vps4 family AAA+-type ATPase